MCAWAGGREVQIIAARFFLLELREMMCEKKSQVKKGLQPKPVNAGERKILPGQARHPRGSPDQVNDMQEER